MSSRQHTRNASSGRKASQQHTSRMTRPGAMSRRSTNNVHSNAPLSPRTASRRSYDFEVVPTDHTHENDEDENMASFLQFCTTCDKQILTPSISLLYCSEACRRRDSAKSIPQQFQYSPPLSPYTPAVHEYPTSNIVPRRSPTILQPLTTTFSELSLYELNPKSSTLPHDDVDESTFGMPTQSVRPYISRNSSSDEAVQVPSLVHSPSSSHGTVASHLELARPLPRKHSSAYKSADLVTPLSSDQQYKQPLTSTTNTEAPRRSSAPNKNTRPSLTASRR